MPDIVKEIDFEKYKTKTLNFSNLKYERLWEVLLSDKASVERIGKSFEGRNLFLLKKGYGKTKIFLWSQMHGNEPLSTLALADILNFLDDKKNIIARTILKDLTIFAIPMLNPDGAEKFIRRNAQEIDINRDAIRLQTPEGKTLEKKVIELLPDFAFNLHDQEIFYGTEKSPYPTAMAFLTPAFDSKRTIDESRKKSMKVISSVIKDLKPYLKDRMAKYNDAFYPTAFGDNIQKKAIPVILMEGGFFEGDYQRKISRKFYFYSLLSALFNIAQKKFENAQISLYENLPLNKKHKFTDILLKNIKIKLNNQTFTADIALWSGNPDQENFNFNEIKIKDIGDLRNISAFEIYECNQILINANSNKLIRGKKADFLLKQIEKCRKIK